MQVEDEIHFVLQCPAYNNLRASLLQDIFNHNLISSNDEQKFIWLMSSEDINTNKQLAKFITAAYEARLQGTNTTNNTVQL
jgi:hypothetical protein